MHRILHVVPSLVASGTTRQLALLADGLPRSEFEIHVAAIDDAATHANGDFQKLGIETFIAGRRWAIDPIALARLRRYVKRLRPALVHTWLFPANTYGWLAALAAGVLRMVATERHIDSWKLPHELAIDRWLADRKSTRLNSSH